MVRERGTGKRGVGAEERERACVVWQRAGTNCFKVLGPLFIFQSSLFYYQKSLDSRVHNLTLFMRLIKTQPGF